MSIKSAIIFLFVFAIGYGNTKNKPDLSSTAPEIEALQSAIEWYKVQDRNGDAYIPNTDQPYSGWSKSTYENGQFKTLTTFEKGSVIREQKWKENGIPVFDIRFTPGEVRTTNLNQVILNVLYRNGVCRYWHDNGQIAAEISFKKNNIDGLFKGWYENGQKKEEINYKEGEVHGQGIRWYKNGQKREEYNYKEGKLVSALAWMPNGEACPATNVVSGNGVWAWYDSDGNEESRELYVGGELVEE